MWRGPMLHRALEQFLSDVNWGDSTTLLIDMPPGTGDIASRCPAAAARRGPRRHDAAARRTEGRLRAGDDGAEDRHAPARRRREHELPHRRRPGALRLGRRSGARRRARRAAARYDPVRPGAAEAAMPARCSSSSSPTQRRHGQSATRRPGTRGAARRDRSLAAARLLILEEIDDIDVDLELLPEDRRPLAPLIRRTASATTESAPRAWMRRRRRSARARAAAQPTGTRQRLPRCEHRVDRGAGAGRGARARRVCPGGDGGRDLKRTAEGARPLRFEPCGLTCGGRRYSVHSAGLIRRLRVVAALRRPCARLLARVAPAEDERLVADAPEPSLPSVSRRAFCSNVAEKLATDSPAAGQSCRRAGP